MALTQISTAGVKDDAVTAGKIPANAVGSSELADNAVDTAAIAADAVTGAKIADDAINSEHYTDGSIDTAHIADSQVTTAKIADDAVTTAKIGSEQVVAANIAGGTITAGKLASNSVTNAKIADDAIGIAELSATGTASSSTFLRGDNSWTAVTSTTINSNTNNYLITGTGTANELQGESELQWNGSNLFVRAGEGESSSLNLIADQGDDNGDGWKIQSEQDENDLTFKSNTSGSYVDKLKLKSSGQLEVQGNVTTTGHFYGPDNSELRLGSSDDLKIFHNGSASYIKDTGTGNLVIASSLLQVTNAGVSENMAKFTENGSVELYYDNSKKFETTADGIKLPDAGKISFNDVSYIWDNNTNNNTYWMNPSNSTYIDIADSSKEFAVTANGTAEAMIKGIPDAQVELYHNGSKKIETKSYGSHFTGYKSQTSYVGFHVMGSNSDHGYGTNHGSGITTYDVSYYSPIPMWSSKTIDHGDTYLSFPSYAGGNYLKFTAPVAGLYQLELIASVESHHGGDWCQMGWEVNTETANSSSNFMNNNRGVMSVNERAGDDTEMGCHFSTTIWLDANDYAVLYQQSTAAVRWRGNQYYARGHLIS